MPKIHGSADVESKMDIVPSAAEGNLASYNAMGKVEDSGVSAVSFDPAGSAESQSLLLARMMDSRDVYRYILDSSVDGRPSRPVTLEYDSATRYYFWQYVSGQYWSRWTLTKNPTGVWSLGTNVDIYSVYEAVNDTAAGITYDNSVSNWATQSIASNIGGTTHYAYNPGMWMEFTVTGYTELWIAYNEYITGGYVVPTIDGSQMLVDKRELEYESVNGEWVFNTYSGTGTTYNNWRRVAAGLDTNQTYTIRLRTSTVTASPGGNRFYFEAYGKPASRVDASDVLDLTHTSKQVVFKAYEFDAGTVFAIIPPGASTQELTGDAHLNESLISGEFIDADGNSVEPSPTIQYQTVDEFSLVQSTYMRHSETGTTNHALHNKVVQFTNKKLRQSIRTEWLTATQVVYYYDGIVKTEGRFGVVAGDATIYELTAADNSQHSNIKSIAGMLWNETNDFVCLSILENPQQHENFENSGRTFLEDKSTGVKLYFRPQDETRTLGVGDVWFFSHKYQLARIPQIEEYV